MKGKMKKLKIAALVSLVLAAAVFIVVFAADVTIDTFDEGDANLYVEQGDENDSDVYDHASILGGEHDITLTWVSGSYDDIRLRIDRNDSNRIAYTSGDEMQGIAKVTWDGNDNSATDLAATGLSNADLTSSNPANDAIVLSVIFADAQSDITLTAYEDASNYGTQTLRAPGDVSSGSRVDMVFPFSAFANTGTGEDFSSLGALVLEIDGTVTSAADISIDNIEATNARDYGDLDATNYGIVSHIPNGLRLGNSVDVEASTLTGSNASGDDSTFDDEDGVTRSSDLWANDATGVTLNIDVNGCSGTCYLNGWIDWDAGDTTYTLSQVITDQSVTNSTTSVDITIPSSSTYTVGDPVYARFRLCNASSTCTSTTGEVTGGEVEDYWWDFGPTSVTVSSLEAHSPWLTSPYTLGAAVLLLVVTMGGVVLVQRRKA